MLTAILIALVIALIVLGFLLYKTLKILKNLTKTSKTISNAKRSCEETQNLILTKLNEIEKTISDVKQISSIMSPILRRKAEYNGKTVDTKSDETKTIPLEVTQ